MIGARFRMRSHRRSLVCVEDALRSSTYKEPSSAVLLVLGAVRQHGDAGHVAQNSSGSSQGSCTPRER